MKRYLILLIPVLFLFVACMEPLEDLNSTPPVETVEQELGPIGEHVLDARRCMDDSDCSNGRTCETYCYREGGCDYGEWCIEQCVGICRHEPTRPRLRYR